MDIVKVASVSTSSVFEPTVMFFGMCNSPSTFQAMMDDIFSDLIDENIVIVYMDDIFLFSKYRSSLQTNTKRVLQRLQDNDLYLKAKKCEFEKEKIEWLGMVIEEGKISMDPGKLKGIHEWPIPTTIKQVRGFLGFGNFYRRFIRGFSEIAKPLNDLLKKDQKFDWNSDHALRQILHMISDPISCHSHLLINFHCSERFLRLAWIFCSC
jgi:hypothetical protein